MPTFQGPIQSSRIILLKFTDFPTTEAVKKWISLSSKWGFSSKNPKKVL